MPEEHHDNTSPCRDEDHPLVLIGAASDEDAGRLVDAARVPSCRLLTAERTDLERLVAKQRPDIVVVDAAADEANGLDACRRLMTSDHGDGVPVIAVLSPARHGAVERAREAGIDEVLMAPVCAREFAMRVRSVVRLRRMRRRVQLLRQHGNSRP